MEQKRAVITIVVIIIVIIAIALGIWIYLDIKENERIDAEALTLAQDLTVEFGKKAKVSDFIEKLNGTLLNDYEIDTEQLGNIEVSFEYLNIKNKQRTATFTIKTIDTIAPKIFSSSSYTVKVGYDKKLEDVLLSGDNADDNPTREIIGEYDFNNVGDYNLSYVVTDSSNNKTSKDFVLHVVESIEKTNSTKENVYIEDVIENYKNDKTTIGIDVSKWQGEINWKEVKNSGIEFAMIRIGYQTDYDGECVEDPYFKQNIEGAMAVRTTSRSIFSFVCKN